MKQRLKTYFSQPTANGQGKALKHQLMLKELRQQLLQTRACSVSSLQMLQDLHNSFCQVLVETYQHSKKSFTLC